MNELTATPTHASVLYLRLGDFSSKPVVEQARIRAQLEAVVAAGLSVLPERDRIVLDTADGIALVVLDNALGALKAAERCRDAAAVLPLCIGAGHGAIALVNGNGAVQGMVGDGLHSAAVAAGFAEPAQLLATQAFREAVAQQEPVRQADLVRAGTYSDASVRTHELFMMDRDARARRRRRLLVSGAAGIAGLLVVGVIGRLAYRAEGPFAPRAEVVLAVSPAGEVFLDGDSRGMTPPLASVKMRAGTHLIEVRHGNDPPLRQELTLKPGERVELRHAFIPMPVLLFDVTPAGGVIFVDGQSRGAIGVLQRLEIVEGAHAVEIRQPGFPPYQRSVNVRRGEQVTIKYAFLQATVVFRVGPGGQVIVDGKPAGTLPHLTQLTLNPGRHVIEVRYGKFPPLQRTLDLRAGQQVVIQHEFREQNLFQRLFKRR